MCRRRKNKDKFLLVFPFLSVVSCLDLFFCPHSFLMIVVWSVELISLSYKYLSELNERRHSHWSTDDNNCLLIFNLFSGICFYSFSFSLSIDRRLIDNTMLNRNLRMKRPDCLPNAQLDGWASNDRRCQRDINSALSIIFSSSV